MRKGSEAGQVARAAGLDDVARLAGVSISTVSRVLAGSRPVGADLRLRVLEAAARLHYVPNPHAQALARAQDNSIGVVVHDLSDPYFSEIVRGVLGVAEQTGRMVLICNTYRDAEREADYIRHFRAQRTEVLVLAGSGRLERSSEGRVGEELIAFEKTGGRAVLVGRREAVGDTVAPDNDGGAREVARHLVGLGHHRIGVVSGPSELTTNFDRLSAFRDELGRLGVELAGTHVRNGGFDRAEAERATRELMLADDGLTALFALNDVMAVGVLACLRKLGFRVPGDVSVVGFDDIPVAADLCPALTTVRVPMAEIGKLALTFAIEPPTQRFRYERVPTELIIRESTGEARTDQD